MRKDFLAILQVKFVGIDHAQTEYDRHQVLTTSKIVHSTNDGANTEDSVDSIDGTAASWSRSPAGEHEFEIRQAISGETTGRRLSHLFYSVRG